MKKILLFILVAYAIASTLDYQSEQDDYRYYCDGVTSHQWPNFKNLECK